MNPAYFAVAVLFALVVVTLLSILVRRRPGTGAVDTELTSLREEKADLQRRLAVAEERSSRLGEVERTLEALNAAKNSAEKQLATACEALARVEISLSETKTRLMQTEKSRDESLSRLEAVKTEKSKLEETLAARSEAINRMETTAEELRGRLKNATEAHEETLARLEAVAGEKSELASLLAQHAARLQSKSESLDQLSGQLDQAVAARVAAERETSELRSRVATIEEALGQERKQAEEKLALLTEARERMAQEFKVLAADVMKSHGETFSKQNKEQIDVILGPLREKLGEFQAGLQTAHSESAKERATLAEQIRQLSEKSARMTLETTNLTRALKGESQTQGAWGEMILESILERSGLREGEEYVIQQSHVTEDGRRLRSDAIVNLPDGRKIVIDSKLSLVAFEEYVNTETEEDRAAHLKRHVASIRAHIRTLSGKNYHSAAGSELDYVILFIPIEGALAAALQETPTLTAEAVEANVAIATPTTLMIALRTASNVWQVERRNRNADEIALRAGKIYDKLAGFVEDMTELGNRLGQARTSYEASLAKLSTGRGNLISQVEQLKKLGAKTNKALSARFVNDPEDEEATEDNARSLSKATAACR
jgi:DNA recombination protein RmuC